MKFLFPTLSICLLIPFFAQAQETTQTEPESECHAGGHSKMLEIVFKAIFEESTNRLFICNPRPRLTSDRERWICGIDYQQDGLLDDTELSMSSDALTHQLPKMDKEDDRIKYSSVAFVTGDSFGACNVKVEYMNGDSIIYRLNFLGEGQESPPVWIKSYHPVSIMMDIIDLRFDSDPK